VPLQVSGAAMIEKPGLGAAMAAGIAVILF